MKRYNAYYISDANLCIKTYEIQAYSRNEAMELAKKLVHYWLPSDYALHSISDLE